MRPIAELNMLLHTSAELPTGLKLAIDEFNEGWSFVRKVDAMRLKKRIQTRGWNFIRFADGLLRSGIGDTSQEAIAGALKLALRRVSGHSNAVEVEHIELTQYPWFFLARVRIYPFRIQQGAVLPLGDEIMPLSVAPRRRRLAASSSEMFPNFGSAMPMLKEMLTTSRVNEARIQ